MRKVFLNYSALSSSKKSENLANTYKSNKQDKNVNLSISIENPLIEKFEKEHTMVKELQQA